MRAVAAAAEISGELVGDASTMMGKMGGAFAATFFGLAGFGFASVFFFLRGRSLDSSSRNPLDSSSR